jgi:hypothetical protein
MSFVSIIKGEAVDLSGKSQLLCTLHYVNLDRNDLSEFQASVEIALLLPCLGIFLT